MPQNPFALRGLQAVKPVDPAVQVAHDVAVQQEQAGWSGPAKWIAEGMDKLPGFMKGLVQQDPTVSREQFDQPGYGAGAMLGAALPFAPKGIPGMYSRLEKLAEVLPESIGVGKLKNILSSGWVAKEETDWRNVPQFLEGFGGQQPVGKGQLIEHLQGNPLDVKVVEKGGKPSKYGVADERYNSDTDIGTQYDYYQMPGAKNYRETLLQLPVETDPGTGANMQPMFSGQHWDEPNVLVHVRHNERDLPGSTLAERNAMDTPTFQAHVNAGLSQPQKGRMLENVQSDWHQRGAHSGYAGDVSQQNPLITNGLMGQHITDLEDAIDAKLTEHQPFLQGVGMSGDPATDAERAVRHLGDRMAQSMGNEEIAPLQRAHDELNALRVQRDNAVDAVSRANGTVPDAPFKDNWAELALKQQLLDVAHNHPDLQWMGIAPSSELRNRGEVISPEFQDKQLPNTLAKLLKPFGGQVETADLGVRSNQDFDYNDQMGQFGGFMTGVQDEHSEPIYSLLGPRFNPEMEKLGGPGEGYPTAALEQLRKGRPNISAPVARLTPDILRQIKEKGFPMMAIMGLMKAMPSHQQEAGQ